MRSLFFSAHPDAAASILFFRAALRPLPHTPSASRRHLTRLRPSLCLCTTRPGAWLTRSEACRSKGARPHSPGRRRSPPRPPLDSRPPPPALPPLLLFRPPRRHTPLLHHAGLQLQGHQGGPLRHRLHRHSPVQDPAHDADGGAQRVGDSAHPGVLHAQGEKKKGESAACQPWRSRANMSTLQRGDDGLMRPCPGRRAMKITREGLATGAHKKTTGGPGERGPPPPGRRAAKKPHQLFPSLSLRRRPRPPRPPIPSP